MTVFERISSRGRFVSLSATLMVLSPATPLLAQTFTRVTDVGPIVTDAFLSTGAAWNDFNGDGWLDMFALGEGQNYLYVNNGDGTFSERTTGDFLTPRGVGNGALWADFDNDGHQDLFIPNFVTVPGGTQLAPNVLFRNSGPPDFTFAEVDLGTALNASPSASWVDYDQDGDVDLFAAGAKTSNGTVTSDLFYRHDSGGVFSNIETMPFIEPRRGVGTHDAWVDVDGDGDQDLFVLNWSSANKLYKSLLVETGNPDHFEAVTSSGLTSDGGIFDIGASWADYDNDGDFDVFFPVLSSSGDRLYRNDGDGTFTRITDTPATLGRSVVGVWGDVDNDGDLDLYTGSQPTALYANDGAGGFVAVPSTELGDLLTTAPSLQSGNWGDYNNDGNLDLYLLTYAVPSNRFGTPQPNHLIKNNGGTTNHYLTIHCVGTMSNRSAVGAKVSVKSAINGVATWQHRFVSGGQSAFVFHGDNRAHFGLGDATNVDSIRIAWPSGIEQIITDQDVDQILTIVEVIPDGFLRSNFIADQTAAEGSTSLTVQFSDASLVDANNPIVSWEWDFDLDGLVDADVANPSWTFSAARDTSFSIGLTVSNGPSSSTLIKTDFITFEGIRTGVDDFGGRASRHIELVENYPNPFSRTTTVVIDVGQPVEATLRLHDMLGRQVKTLASGMITPGRHEIAVDAANLAVGVYVVLLQSDGIVQSRTLTVAR